MSERDEGKSTDEGRPSRSDSDTKWTPRVEGEEGDPTAFDFVFGGTITVIVIVAILWGFGVIAF
jgi:hypothetical protein